MKEINQFDLAFIVDATASMGGFISNAKSMMIKMTQELATNSDIDMKIGVVEYRDHPPQDNILLRIHQLGDFDEAQKCINKLTAQGGGDGPEAVIDGVMGACKQLKWRKHSRRIAVLVGDAPPHGVSKGYGDAFPKGCPCGDTIETITAAAEDKNITLYAIALTGGETAESFQRIAQLTGGASFTTSGGGDAAVKKIQAILKDEFGNLELDKKVLDAWDDESTTDSLAEKLQAKPTDVANSTMRLMTRKLLVRGLVPA